jgi:prephenate dehydratase
MTARRIGYLGPIGTFTHEALLSLGFNDADAVAYPSITDVLDAVASSDVDLAVVPIENAIEGTVSATIDGLLFDHDLLIEREIVIPIRLHLMAKAGTELSDITAIASYSHALAQCRRFLATLGSVRIDAVASTADAARIVASSDETIAALASDAAARTFSLVIVAADVEDHDDNETRFVVIGRDVVPAPTGQDRTSIVCFQDADRPGSLYAILGGFAARDINLTKLESRPTKRGLGEYCFVIEFDGHIANDVIADCLSDLQAHVARVKFLGSYPVTGVAAASRREEVIAARASANEWMQQLRGRIVPERQA